MITQNQKENVINLKRKCDYEVLQKKECRKDIYSDIRMHICVS